MKTFALLITATFVIGFNASALADADAENTARTLCAGCHGPNGISTNEMWPNLAGQKAGYTAKQLRDYRDNKRSDPSMTGLSQTLTDEQIQALAEYYAKLPAEG